MTLREARQARGWTLKEVAEAIGTKEAAVSRWETGSRVPTHKHAKRLCVLYDMTYEELFGMEVD